MDRLLWNMVVRRSSGRRDGYDTKSWSGDTDNSVAFDVSSLRSFPIYVKQFLVRVVLLRRTFQWWYSRSEKREGMTLLCGVFIARKLYIVYRIDTQNPANEAKARS